MGTGGLDPVLVISVGEPVGEAVVGRAVRGRSVGLLLAVPIEVGESVVGVVGVGMIVVGDVVGARVACPIKVGESNGVGIAVVGRSEGARVAVPIKVGESIGVVVGIAVVAIGDSAGDQEGSKVKGGNGVPSRETTNVKSFWYTKYASSLEIMISEPLSIN